MYKATTFFVPIVVLMASSDTSASNCSVETFEKNGLTEISAYVSGNIGATGTYDLTTISVNGGNRSISRQGGKFSIEGPETMVLLSRSLLGRSPEKKIKVQLTVSTANESVACSKTLQ